MKDALSRAGRAALAEFTARNVLVGLDYDGTLAPLVADSRKAALRPRTRALLGEVAARYPCAVVSGRAQRDVARLLRGIPLRAVVGNHGAEPEPRPPPSALRRQVVRWRDRLADTAVELPGVHIEDKLWSLSVHYRGAAPRARAHAALLAAARALPGARVVGGKNVLNVVHPGAPHKGMALRQLCRRFSCDAAIYVGDDETDEDVFALGRPSRLLAVGVGTRRGSRATLRLRDQAAIDALLALLVSLRRAA